MMRKYATLTVGVSSLLFFAGIAQASDRTVSYATVDTTVPMSEFQLRDLCNRDLNTVANKLTEVANRLTGNPTSLQVGGRYSITPQIPNSPGIPGPHPGQIYRYVCELTFVSRDASVGFNAYSAVHHTHLSSSTWGTACKPEFDQIAANPNSIITNYIKSSTLFQGRICEVTTVQAEKN